MTQFQGNILPYKAQGEDKASKEAAMAVGETAGTGAPRRVVSSSAKRPAPTPAPESAPEAPAPISQRAQDGGGRSSQQSSLAPHPHAGIAGRARERASHIAKTIAFPAPHGRRRARPPAGCATGPIQIREPLHANMRSLFPPPLARVPRRRVRASTPPQKKKCLPTRSGAGRS